jgi:hypothetical protein
MFFNELRLTIIIFANQKNNRITLKNRGAKSLNKIGYVRI